MSLRLDLDNIFSSKDAEESPVREFTREDTEFEEVGTARDRMPLHITHHQINVLYEKTKVQQELDAAEVRHSFTPILGQRTIKLAEKRRQSGRSPLHVDTRQHRQKRDWVLTQSSIIMRESPKRKIAAEAAQVKIAAFLQRQKKYSQQSKALKRMAIVVQHERTHRPTDFILP